MIRFLFGVLLSLPTWSSTLEMEVGQTRLIDTAGVSEVLLGDGAIGEVRALSATRALVVAKAVGETEMYFFDSGVTQARLRVIPQGTRLGPVRLRLVLVEVQAGDANASGLGSELSLSGQIQNKSSQLDVLGQFRLGPSRQGETLNIVAQPRLRLLPTQQASLNVGGEIERTGEEGEVSDKAYGFELNARFHWLSDGRAQLSQEISLRTPSGEGQFRVQTLNQISRLGLLEVVEFARFDAREAATKRRAGWPFNSKENDQQTLFWRVFGWIEPVENT